MFFEFVRLVEDDRSAIGKHAGVGSAFGFELDGEVSEKQMVVDDDNVALGRAPPHFGDEAAVVFLTFLAEASVGPGVELRPESARLRREFGAIAGLGCFLPGGNGAVVLNLFQPAEHGLVGEVDQFFAAEIIVAALHVADAQFAVAIRKEGKFKRGNVFVEKLFLQIFGACGNDDALAGTDHGQQVSKCFAGTCAGFDDQVTPLFQRFFDSLSHFQLTAPKLIGGVGFREQASGREELVEGESGCGSYGMG